MPIPLKSHGASFFEDESPCSSEPVPESAYPPPEMLAIGIAKCYAKDHTNCSWLHRENSPMDIYVLDLVDRYGLESYATAARAAVFIAREIIRSNKRVERDYLVTFTVDPKKHPVAPEDRIEKFVIDQSKRQTALGIISLSYVKEKHLDGRPHWHMHFKTNKVLKKDRFNYYTQEFGAVDISTRRDSLGTGTSDQEVLNYISKCGKATKLI